MTIRPTLPLRQGKSATPCQNARPRGQPVPDSVLCAGPTGTVTVAVRGAPQGAVPQGGLLFEGHHIAWFGYKAIAAFERWTVPPTIVILAVMSAVAWFGMDINWSYAGPAGNVLEGSERIAAMSAVMTAIGIGWGNYLRLTMTLAELGAASAEWEAEIRAYPVR